MPFHVAIGQSRLNRHCHRLFTVYNSDAIRNMIFRESDVVLIESLCSELWMKQANSR